MGKVRSSSAEALNQGQSQVLQEETYTKDALTVLYFIYPQSYEHQ